MAGDAVRIARPGEGKAMTETVEPTVTGTQSVFRALSILRAFSAGRPTLTGPEVAEIFGYSPPTAYRLLRALEAEQFVVFDQHNRAYSPGPEILRLAGVMLHRDEVVSHTQSALIRLRALTGETVAIHWRLGNKCTCTQELPSPQPTRIEAGIGADFPLTRGAPGKALLLDLDEREIRRLIDDPEVSEPDGGVDGLLADLAISRQRGYTLSVGETIEGAVSIAAPIPWLEQGLAVYSVTAPESRFSPRTAEAAARTLVEEMRRLRSILLKQNPFG